MITFKKAPNYIPGQAPPGVWKEQLLINLGKYFKLDYFTETGSSTGSTSKACAPHFKLITTIELSEKYYNESKELLKSFANVDCVLGDSAVELDRILKHSPKQIHLFWLDSHKSAPDSADNGDVLPNEISSIQKYSDESLIVIDDQKDDSLQNLVEAGIDLTGWVKKFVTGVVIMHKEGLYELPEFEEA